VEAWPTTVALPHD